jgi:hypothetical protein
MGTIAIRVSVAVLAAGISATVAAALPATSAAPGGGSAASPPFVRDPAPGEDAAKEFQCGTVGLSVVAKSVYDREGACETARKVAKAAMDGSAPGTSGFAGLTGAGRRADLGVPGPAGRR